MNAHSAAVCQCSSRIPPAVRRMSTPAMLLETGSSRTVTSRDQPPLCRRLCENENGYLKGGTPPASVSGGSNELLFCASISGLLGPGSLLRRALPGSFCSLPGRFATEFTPAAARATDPVSRKLRRESLLSLASSGTARSFPKFERGCETMWLRAALLGYRHCRLARRIEKGQGNDVGGHRAAAGLDGHFDVQRAAENRVFAADRGESDHFLQCR